MFCLHKFLHFNFDVTFVHVPRVSACREVSWVISETVLLAICRWDGYFSNHDSECCNIRSHLEKVQAWAQLNASLCCESHINVTKIQAIFLCDHERVYDRSHAKVRYIYTLTCLFPRSVCNSGPAGTTVSLVGTDPRINTLLIFVFSMPSRESFRA